MQEWEMGLKEIESKYPIFFDTNNSFNRENKRNSLADYVNLSQVSKDSYISLNLTEDLKLPPSIEEDCILLFNKIFPQY